LQLWTTEYGTLWTLGTDESLPPFCQARIEVAFKEVREDESVAELAAAMNLATSRPIRRRLSCRRRCFVLKTGDQIVTYGWVTRGAEYVGELEREFHLHNDEAYIWDCVTLPAWRGQRGYSALLSHIIYRLHDERDERGAPSVSRIWIGASRQNRPSVQGFVNAGFNRVVDLAYHRLYRLTLMWLRPSATAGQPIVVAATRILLDERERRFGPLVVGYK
jgi:GNAT superfamily N-acetyltransferase